MPARTKAKRPRPDIHLGPPPIGPALRDAAGRLAEALTPALAAVLDASDEFQRSSWDMPQRDRDLAALLLKAVRDAWAGLSGHRDEAERLHEEGAK